MNEKVDIIVIMNKELEKQINIIFGLDLEIEPYDKKTGLPRYLTSGRRIFIAKSSDVDFYIVKGIVEDILDYMGFKNRYSFEISDCLDLHPGISADILLDRKKIGILGRVHPKLVKDPVYVFELSLQALMSKIKPIKYKAAAKYPIVEKDLAFVLDKNIIAGDVEKTIKKAGGRLLTNISVFDVYTGENIDKNKKSIAFSLTFMDPNKTLEEKEVMDIFNNIIDKVVNEFNCELRDK